MKLTSTSYDIEFGALEKSSFSKILEQYKSFRKIIMVDENTHEFCLEFLITQFDELTDAEIILLPAGEENKVMEVCFQVWQALSEYKISRSDLVINLGGGVVTDMGGFIASIFKRGVKFINIPTSLLSMVDASVGGKTGIDLGAYKNQLGVFSDPLVVYIDHRFLSTLPKQEWVNGYAEMLKHGIIRSEKHWNKLIKIQPEEINLELIFESVSIKNEIVLKDPKESGERKLLNFGHTIGHAIEGYFLEKGENVPHGTAVAWGMLLESKIALNKNMLSQNDFSSISKVINTNFPPIPNFKNDSDIIFEIMLQDKKNSTNLIKCVLPTKIGSVNYDEIIQQEDLVLIF